MLRRLLYTFAARRLFEQIRGRRSGRGLR